MIKGHENYRELVLRLAKTDFKLRYHGSTLGYLWAIIKPLSLFTVLNFVFSSIFNFRNSTTTHYPLELLTGILLFQFFSEGTTAGMTSLVSKSQLVTKIYVPKWTIVLSTTINALFVFLTNLVVLFFFFVIYGKVPTFGGIVSFFMYVVLLYILIVAFSLATSTLFVRFRDLSAIWEVLLLVLMYASPIVYPLGILPDHIQKLLLLSPLAFIINFSKQALVYGTLARPGQILLFVLGVLILALVSIVIFKKFEKDVAEFI